MIDSCRDQVDKQQPALAYLRGLGVDLAEQVKLVLGTHAHDDHIAGISEVFEASQKSVLALSSAMTSEEFFAAVEADETVEPRLRKRIRAEYRKLFELVEARGSASLGWSLKRATEGRDLWTRATTVDQFGAKAVALSPSDRAVTRAQNLLALGTAQTGQRKKLSASDPNEFAVALWIETDLTSILLGADLLNGPEGCGWGAVLASHTSENKATYFKVPHHGSPTSDHEGVWQDLLVHDPVTTLAPYRAGVTPRPSPEDIARLLNFTPTVYVTARPDDLAPSRAVRRANASLAQIGGTARDVWGTSGHVRARFGEGGQSWTVECFRPARAVSRDD